MSFHYTYKTKGTCSTQIDIDLDGNTIEKVVFTKGCKGNLEGMSRMVKGQDVDDVIQRLRGTRCGENPTSCPDQLSWALEEAKKLAGAK